jgi:hypothetical protein
VEEGQLRWMHYLIDGKLIADMYLLADLLFRKNKKSVGWLTVGS